MDKRFFNYYKMLDHTVSFSSISMNVSINETVDRRIANLAHPDNQQ